MSKKKKNQEKDENNNAVKIAIITGRVTIAVAMIGLIGTLSGLLFDFGPFVGWFNTPIPTTSAPATISTAPNSFTPELTTTDPHILDPTTTETVKVVLPSATPTTGLPIGMQVILTANQTIGKSPLTVKLDARDSFLRAPDGTVFECRKGACSYVWYVYLNNVEFTKPQETRGTIEFRFDKKGTYFVSVYICHGADNPICGNSGTAVIVE